MKWSPGQITQFAKDLKKGDAGRVWPYIGNDLRQALIDQKVLQIVLGQDVDSITILAITELGAAITKRLARKPFGMRVWDDVDPNAEGLIAPSRPWRLTSETADGLEIEDYATEAEAQEAATTALESHALRVTVAPITPAP